jgi:Fe-S-cluster containining protein
MKEMEAHARSDRFRESDPCPWQDPESGRCIHYEVRPVLCRWFEPGSRACNDLRQEAGLSELVSRDA